MKKIIITITLLIISYYNINILSAYNNCTERSGCEIYNDCSYTRDSMVYNETTFQYEKINKTYTVKGDLDKYTACKISSTSNVSESQNDIVDSQCTNAREQLSEIYKKSFPHLTGLENNDTISYHLRELKKLNNNYSKYLNIANDIEWCLTTYTYQEWYSYNKWIEYEYSNKFDLAIIEYKKSLNYTKKEVWNDYLSDNVYINTVDRINNISRKENIIWLCGIKSYQNESWSCKCEEYHEWKYPNLDDNFECKLKDEIQEWIKEIQNKQEEVNQCWINEYYHVPTEEDLLYDFGPSCNCKEWYDKVPGSDKCSIESKYVPTKKDILIHNTLNKKIKKIYDQTPDKMLKLIPKLEQILPKLNKNSQKYYLINGLHSTITLLEFGIDIEY